MGTLRGLAARMNMKADELDENANAMAVWFAKHLVSALIRDTPVDTARALSNWLISYGVPSNQGTLDFVPGSIGSTASTNRAQATQRAHTLIDAKIPGEALYISNVVRYIVYLNRGTSNQAPAMFVESAVLRSKLALQKMINSGGFSQ